LPSGSGGLDPANLEWGEIVGTLSNQTDLQSALNAKVDDALSIGTGTSLAIDFTTNKLHEISISANATLTITGLAIGETGVIFVSNTHATTGASVAFPDVLTETSSAYVPALTTVEITVTRLTSTYRIKWEGALS
jgi:hypothetical protein